MTDTIAGLIQACAWSPSQYLIISQNVFEPLIYYSHVAAIVPTILIVAIIFFNGRKEFATWLLMLMTVFFSVWVFCDLVLWASEFPSYIVFFWTVEDMVEPLVYFFALYFFFVHIFKRDFSKLQKILFTIPLLPTIILAPTKLMILGYDLSNCDRAAVEGILATYGYAIEILYTVLIIGYAVYALIKLKERSQRVQTLLLAFGISAFLLSFSIGNIVQVFNQNWSIDQYNLFGAPVFVAFLAYLISRYKTFNVRLIGAQLLVASLWISIVSLLFIQNLPSIRIVVSLTLIFLLIVGILLVRGVYREIKQREDIEKLAKDLESANDRLKQLDQLKSEFLSVASHQLRAPITAIRGYAANILDGSYGAVPQYLQQPVEVLEESSRLMASSIEDYLNISRIEQGRMKYEKSDFDLTDLTKKVVAELKPVATKKSLTLDFKGDAPLKVNADIGKVKQVISNLTDNAIKYTEKGGVTLTVEKADTKARVTISDTGIGIAADEIPNLFSKFTRARDANKVNTTGTGLGLYVAKQLAEGNGGSIRIESDGVGKGSRFIIELPA